MLPFHKAQPLRPVFESSQFKHWSVWTEAPKVRTPLLFFLGAGEGNVTNQGGEGRANSGIKFIKDRRMPSSLQWSRVKDMLRAEAKSSLSSLLFLLFLYTPKPEQKWVRSL